MYPLDSPIRVTPYREIGLANLVDHQFENGLLLLEGYETDLSSNSEDDILEPHFTHHLVLHLLLYTLLHSSFKILLFGLL